MKNKPVGVAEARDIDSQVRRVLRELGDPEPPLRLELVRELEKLDRHFYSSEDPSALQEMVSRIRRAGKQIVARPMLLLEAVRKAELSAFWIPDGRRILIDSGIPDLKKRWAEGHEIGHSLADWHRSYLLGDDSYTLSSRCHERLENEANYGAGRLLFLQERFMEEARDLTPSLKAVRQLAKRYGNTQSTTLWRFAEQAEHPMVAVVCGHPDEGDADFDPSNPCKYVIESASFRQMFTSSVSEAGLYRTIREYCAWKRGGPLGTSEQVLSDANGDGQVFRFETWYNQYGGPQRGAALTLAVYVRPVTAHVAVAR